MKGFGKLLLEYAYVQTSDQRIRRIDKLLYKL